MKDCLYNLATDKTRGFFASFCKLLLWLLSLVYGLVVSILVFLNTRNQYRPGCKVISVGNITLGGTGKTSLVEYIARALLKEDRKIAVLSRGYKRKIASSSGDHVNSSQEMGDEPFMLKENLAGVPVIAGIDRVKSANLAIKEYGVDTVILDDAFQQWKIKKDLEIVTIDTTNPFGNRHLIPRGILREPLWSLKRADIFVLTKANLSSRDGELKSVLGKINNKALIIESYHLPERFYNLANPKEIFALDQLKNKTAGLFSGIGDPGSFEKLVETLGVKTGFSARFTDHHSYTQEEIDKIIKDTKACGAEFIITTQKDAARLSGLRITDSGLRILVLRIQLAIKDETAFNSRLLKLYSL